MKQKLRTVLQLLFLFLFIFILRSGNLQLWMRLVIATVILSVVAGRFYCGWLCPINTLMRPVEWLNKKLKRKARPVPTWAGSKLLSYLILTAMIVMLVLSVAKGLKIPIMVILVPLAIIATLFFQPALWHRYLCPFGILYSLTARWSRLGVYVGSGCSGCSLCTRVCPAEAITVSGEDKKATVKNNHCLECLLCQDVCPKEAVHFPLQK